MMNRPDHIRVRARSELHPPAGVQVLPCPKTADLPQGGQVGRWVGKSQVYGHETKTGHDAPARTLSRAERKEAVITWMVTHGVTNRAAVFAGCPESHGSASLHHSAINILRRAGLIERVWREYVFCVDDDVLRDWLAQRQHAKE
jgi:hypothetical protein